MSFYRIVIPYRVCRSREKILQRRGTINTMAYRGKIKHEYSCSSYWYSNMVTVLKNLRNLDNVSILYITDLKSERERESVVLITSENHPLDQENKTANTSCPRIHLRLRTWIVIDYFSRIAKKKPGKWPDKISAGRYMYRSYMRVPIQTAGRTLPIVMRFRYGRTVERVEN